MTECKHERWISIGGKVSDSFGIVTSEGEERFDIYVPTGAGIGECDYIEMQICETCHVVIGLNVDALLAALR